MDEKIFLRSAPGGAPPDSVIPSPNKTAIRQAMRENSMAVLPSKFRQLIIATPANDRLASISAALPGPVALIPFELRHYREARTAPQFDAILSAYDKGIQPFTETIEDIIARHQLAEQKSQDMAENINWGQFLPGDFFLSVFFAYLIGFIGFFGFTRLTSAPKLQKTRRKVKKLGRALLPRHRKPVPRDYEDSS